MIREQELKEKISENRIIRKRSGHYICKFCKKHPDDCFCNDNAKLELKGIEEGRKEERENEIKFLEIGKKVLNFCNKYKNKEDAEGCGFLKEYIFYQKIKERIQKLKEK